MSIFNQSQAIFFYHFFVDSLLLRNPDTNPNYHGKWDDSIISGSKPGTKLVIKVGRYGFDKNPFIGYIANINAWDRIMSQEGNFNKQC